MSRPRSTASRRSTRACSRRWRRPARRSRGRSCRGWARRWRRSTSRSCWPWTTCICSTTRHALTRSRRSRDTFATARSSPCRRAARPRLPAGRAAGAGPGAGDRARRPAHGRGGRRASCCARPAWSCRTSRSPSSPSTPRAGPRVSTSPRCRSGRAGVKASRRGYVLRERPARVGLPAVGAARAPVCGRGSLPDADLRSRAHVGAALRRGPRGERLRVDAGVAGALQPVPGAARRPWGVVPLPPPLPGAAPIGAGAGRAGSRAPAPRSGSRLVRGERAAGGGDRVRAGGRRRRPRGAAGRAVRATRIPERPRGDRRALARAGWRRTGHSSATRRSPCSARCCATLWGRPAEAERWAEAAERASYDGALPDGSASIDSWRALLRAMRCQRGVARMRADAELAVRTLARGSPLPAARIAAARRSRGCWQARSTRPTTSSPTSSRRASSWERRTTAAVAARRARRDRDRARSVGPGRGARGPGASGHPPLADGGVPDQRARLRAGGARRAPPRRNPARRRAPRSGAAPAAAAHLRDAVAVPSRRAWSSRAPTSRSPTPAAPRRCCARSTRCCAGNRTSARSPPRSRSCARA